MYWRAHIFGEHIYQRPHIPETTYTGGDIYWKARIPERTRDDQRRHQREIIQKHMSENNVEVY
jgi:hypothetical protein